MLLIYITHHYPLQTYIYKIDLTPRQIGLVVSVPFSHVEGRGFAPGQVIPKTFIIMIQTAFLRDTQALG